MLRVAGALVAVAIVAVIAVLIFGGDDPELSPQDQSTPTAPAASPTGDGVLRVPSADSGLDVPPTVTRTGRTLLLEYDNTSAEAVEVILARGAPKGRAAIQKALITGSVVQAKQQQRDGVNLEPGSYTVLIHGPRPD